MFRMVLADQNEEFRHLVQRAAAAVPDSAVVGSTESGLRALELVRRMKPELLVTDLILTDLDGLTLLEKVSTLASRPRILVVSAFSSDYAVNAASTLGADCFLSKPCSRAALVRNMEQLRCAGAGGLILNALAGEQEELERQVTAMLRELGVPAHLKGYPYLRRAVVMTVCDMNLLGAVTKQLYPALAAQYGVTPGSVERAIRSAVEVAWDRCDPETLRGFFAGTVSGRRGKPTNSEFIALVADTLALRRRQAR